MNSFMFNLPGKHFICPCILNDSFAEQSNLGCMSLLSITLNTSCQSLLACKFSFEKSADSLMGTPLQVILSLSLIAFKIICLSLICECLIMMYLGMFLFGSNFYRTLCAFWICMFISFTNQECFLSLFFQVSFQLLALLLLLLAPL